MAGRALLVRLASALIVSSTPAVAAAECGQPEGPVEKILDVTEQAAAGTALSTDLITASALFKYDTCNPIEVVTHEGYEAHDIRVQVRLCDLDSSPLTTEELATQIEGVAWVGFDLGVADGDATWTLENGDGYCPVLTLELAGASTSTVSLWRQLRPQPALLLSSGHAVMVDIGAGAMLHDYSAARRVGTLNSIEATETTIGYYEGYIADLEKKIADPTLIDSGLEDVIAYYQDPERDLTPRDRARLAELLQKQSEIRATRAAAYPTYIAEYRDDIHKAEARIQNWLDQMEAPNFGVRTIPTEHGVDCDDPTAPTP